MTHRATAVCGTKLGSSAAWLETQQRAKGKESCRGDGGGGAGMVTGQAWWWDRHGGRAGTVAGQARWQGRHGGRAGMVMGQARWWDRHGGRVGMVAAEQAVRPWIVSSSLASARHQLSC